MSKSSIVDTNHDEKSTKKLSSPLKEEDSEEEEWDESMIIQDESTVKDSLTNQTKSKDEKNQDQNTPNQNSSSSSIQIITDPVQSIGKIDDNSAPQSSTIISGSHDLVPPSAESLKQKQRLAVLTSKSDRQKKREDCISAHCIKNQLKSTVASFDEDTFTQVIDSVLKTNTDGLGLVASRCKGKVCCFCGLSDLALGTNLVRVPNEKEWAEMIINAYNSRKFLLTAEIETESERWKNGKIKENVEEDKQLNLTKETENMPKRLDTNMDSKKKLVVVSIRLGDQLFSTPNEEKEYYEDIPDNGMCEFLPSNPVGFQYELNCRLRDNLPFLTGSSIAHECCAVASQKARKEKMLQDLKDKKANELELDFGNSCGRTLSYGSDVYGRSYWKFPSDPSSLYVLAKTSNNESKNNHEKIFHRFKEPEAIASVLVCLGKDEVVDELRRAFPGASTMISNREWCDLLQKKAFNAKSMKQILKTCENENGSMKRLGEDLKNADSGGEDTSNKKSEEEPEPYEAGEDVLVESLDGDLLWDAKIISVSKDSNEEMINGYRVHYKDWSSRFDEWVKPTKVVEPSENNLIVQSERLEENVRRKAFPGMVKELAAISFLFAKDRSRALNSPFPETSKILSLGPGASNYDKIFTYMKIALLLLEYSLPVGSINTSENGRWSPEVALCWRSLVENSDSPAKLMGCLTIFEDVISNDWIRPNCEHLLQCLPKHWKAMNEATIASLALRIWQLDSGIKYALAHKDSISSSKGSRKSR